MRVWPAVALALLLTTLGVQAIPNLLQNGGPEQLPDKSKLPAAKVWGDSGAIIYGLDAGSTALPGWTVTKATIRIYDWSSMMPGDHEIDLHGAGGIQQKIATTAGQKYRLDFKVNSQNDNHVKVTLAEDGAQASNVFVPNHQPPKIETWVFTARQPQTTLVFTSNDAPCYGPYLTGIRVSEYNPASEKIQPAVEHVYRTMQEGFSARDLQRVSALLAEDFSFHPRTGDAQDRTAYLQTLQDAMNNSGALVMTVSHIDATDQGAEVVADLFLRTTEKDSQGASQRIRYQSRVHDLWQVSGDTWQLKSRTEDFATRSVDH